METYLVGGAVRDKLLELPVEERDWVVVGATPEDMLALGFKQVGRDFPVFLHPDSGEEYALARTERKIGHGYKGFEVHADPDITLEEDLRRRDLTINAMAEDHNGKLIDPYNGYDDLRAGLLRHVSPAFAEDPVRILRVARFAARFADWGFHVAHATNALMRNMVEAGEVDYLVPERVWAELEKALRTDHPEKFFQVLRGCGALKILFPEIDNAYPPAHGAHGRRQDNPVLLALERAATYSKDPRVRFSALLLALAAHDHDDAAITAGNLCRRFRAPNAYCELATIAIRHATQANSRRPQDLLQLLTAGGAYRHPERWRLLLETYAATGLIDAQRRTLLTRLRDATAGINAAQIKTENMDGRAIGQAIENRRLEVIKNILADAERH